MQKTRPLGGYERLFHWVITNKDSFVTVQISRFNLTGEWQQANTRSVEDVVKKAVELWQSRFEILHSGISKDEWFVTVDLEVAKRLMHDQHLRCVDKNQDQRDDLFRVYADEFVSLGAKQFASVSDLECGLLWNMVLLYDSRDQSADNEIVLSMHHAVADGLSLTVMLNDLFGLIDSVIQEQPVADLYHPLAPRVEDLLPKYVPSSSPQPVSVPPLGYPKLSDGERYQRLSFLTMSQDDSNKIFASCKRRGITVNSAICAALFFGGYQNSLLKEYGTPSDASCTMYISVSLRNYCTPKVENSSIGLFYSGFSAKILPGEICHNFCSTEFWQLAENLQTQISEFVKDPTTLNVSSTDTWYNNVTGYMSQRESVIGRLDHMCVSNRGRIDSLMTERQTVKLKDLFVVTTQQGLGNYFTIHALSYKSQLMLSLASLDSFVSKDLHDQVMKDIQSTLVTFCC